MAREDRISFRAPSELRALLQKVADELKEPWNESRVAQRIIELFLESGVETAVARIKSGQLSAGDVVFEDARTTLSAIQDMLFRNFPATKEIARLKLEAEQAARADPKAAKRRSAE